MAVFRSLTSINICHRVPRYRRRSVRIEGVRGSNPLSSTTENQVSGNFRVVAFCVGAKPYHWIARLHRLTLEVDGDAGRTPLALEVHGKQGDHQAGEQ